MSLHPEARALMDRFADLGARPLHELGVLGARAAVHSSRVLQGETEAVASVRDMLAAGRLPVRLYHPRPGVRLPLLVYLHGGGWTTGGITVSDRPCRSLAVAANCVVASVEFRLSPETRFPGPLDDVLDAVAWLAGRRDELGTDTELLVLVGDSSGGNLAAAAALELRDRDGPALSGQVLLYPALSAPPGLRSADPGEGTGTGLTRAEMDWFWGNYLPDSSFCSAPLAAPLCAPGLAGLPPTFVVTAEYDVLRDEGAAYAERLRVAGVEVRHRDAAGMVHGFLWMLGALPSMRSSLTDIGQFVSDL